MLQPNCDTTQSRMVSNSYSQSHWWESLTSKTCPKWLAIPIPNIKIGRTHGHNDWKAANPLTLVPLGYTTNTQIPQFKFHIQNMNPLQYRNKKKADHNNYSKMQAPKSNIQKQQQPQYLPSWMQEKTENIWRWKVPIQSLTDKHINVTTVTV